MRRLLIAGVMAMAGLIGGAVPAAQAAGAPVATDSLNLAVCDGCGTTIFVALGWRDQAGWHNRGWWRADPGRCVSVPIKEAQLYYHWESEAQTNCICPPPVENNAAKGATMLATRGPKFDFNGADRPPAGGQLAPFNPVLLTADALNPALLEGVDKLVVGESGDDTERLYVHQRNALMPLP
ncbi:MAG: DUF1036 domain-containing protein [Rhodospirillales bacterium]|nr:DUF1036 domain-containing protein [Rhodospirillales bacterium]